MNKDQILYYSERAKEYEQIYQKPERQEDLKQLKTILKDIFSEKSVFDTLGLFYWHFQDRSLCFLARWFEPS